MEIWKMESTILRLKLALDIAKVFETTVEELFHFSDDNE